MKVVTGLAACLLLAGLAVPAAAQWFCVEDFYAVVEGSTVTVFHDGALYNCCPEEIVYDVQVDGALITVTETEILGQEICLCFCCFDLSVTIGDLLPGPYDIAFHWFDYDTQAWQVWPLQVVVPDVGQTGDPGVVDLFMSACYEGATAVPDPDAWPGPPPVKAGSWGGLKAVYR